MLRFSLLSPSGCICVLRPSSSEHRVSGCPLSADSIMRAYDDYHHGVIYLLGVVMQLHTLSVNLHVKRRGFPLTVFFFAAVSY